MRLYRYMVVSYRARHAFDARFKVKVGTMLPYVGASRINVQAPQPSFDLALSVGFSHPELEITSLGHFQVPVRADVVDCLFNGVIHRCGGLVVDEYAAAGDEVVAVVFDL
jgi:hypothetical protein